MSAIADLAPDRAREACRTVGWSDDRIAGTRFTDDAPAMVGSADVDVVVEATGGAAGFRIAVAATRPRGTLVLKSTVAEHASVDLAPLVIHEISVVGSRCGPFEPALALLDDGRIDPRPLIHARYPLTEAVTALERAAHPDTLKVILDVASGEGAG